MTNIPAGYYPDPAGSSQQRWWNGASWGELQAVTANPYAAAQPYGSVQPYGAVQPYDPSQSYYAATGLRAPEGTNPTTTQAWLLALWPLLGFINLGITAALGGFSYDYLSSPTSSFDSATLAANGFNILAWLGFVAVAYSDHSELKRRGVPKPFPWGWAFINIVYVIGRGVVVHSRTGRGLAPLFVFIGAVVLNWIVGFVVGLALSASIINSVYN
jgi:hypothetical protein